MSFYDSDTLKYRIKVPVNFGLKFLWYGNIFHENIALSSFNWLKIGISCMSEHPFTIFNVKNLLFCVNLSIWKLGFNRGTLISVVRLFDTYEYPQPSPFHPKDNIIQAWRSRCFYCRKIAFAAQWQNVGSHKKDC